jgi:glycosyltransferase involved in cell wall biosynthesis
VKIVVAHSRYNSAVPSGENRVVDAETDALRRAGHTVIPYERSNDEISSWSLTRRAALPLAVVNSRTSRAGIVDVIERHRPDVVHVHNTFPLLTPSVLRGAHSAGVPVVTTLHNTRLLCARGDFFRDGTICRDCVGRVPVPALAHGCYRDSALATAPILLSTAVHRKAWRDLPSAYIFVSEAHRQALAEMEFPSDRCHVKWNLVPRPPKVARSHENLVLYLGRLDRAKGIELVMNAWERFQNTFPGSGLELVIAGDGPLAGAVREWAGRHEDVRMLGMIDHTESSNWLARARACVVPSLVRESFGLVVVESMALGVPPVVADHGALPELVQEGVDGVRFRPGDAADLARVLVDIARNPDRWQDLGRAAKRAYDTRFDPDRNLAQLTAIYEAAIELCARGNTPDHRAQPSLVR